MMQLVIHVANLLFKYAYPIYRPLYFAFKGYKDKQEIQHINKLVKPGQTIIDIGANIGFFSMLFSKLVGLDGKVFCFEPDSTNFRHLNRNVGNYSNITLIKGAVGPFHGTTRMYYSDNLNVDHRTYRPEKFASSDIVDMYSLDEFIPVDQKVDLIKMDIQGFEMKAFSGMKRLLERQENICIISEFWPYGLKLSGSSGHEMINFLIGLRFKIFIFTENGLVPIQQLDPAFIYKVEENTYFNLFAQRGIS